jgi:uncharacterized protein
MQLKWFATNNTASCSSKKRMIPSPCINICKMDAENGLCLGCFRTIDEITVWSRTNDANRARIMAAVAQRQLAMQPLENALRDDQHR